MNFRVPFVHIDYKSHLQNLFAPIVVSTNLKELAFDCQGTAAIAAKSGCPIVVLYAPRFDDPHWTALHYLNAYAISHKRFSPTHLNPSRVNTAPKVPLVSY